MIKCGALYLVIAVSLIIGVICTTLILSFLIFRLQYAKTERSSRLELNANSGINILLADSDSIDPAFKLLDLYNDRDDSIAIKKVKWGLFSVGVVRSFHNKDTLTKIFSACNLTDTLNTPAIYLQDENHPLYITKTTKIAGRINIPDAKLQLINLEETTYEKETASKIIIKASKKHLPKLKDTNQLTHLYQFDLSRKKVVADSLEGDTVNNSFSNSPLVVKITNKYGKLHKKAFNGNIILVSDSMITVDSTCKLTNVILFAPKISVKSGFSGSCQLFSTNTVSVASHCSLNYPSAIVLLNIKDRKNDHHQVLIGDSTMIAGAIMSQATSYQSIPIYMSIGKGCELWGPVYCDGLITFNGPCKIIGSIYTRRLLTSAPAGTFENILIDLNIKPIYTNKYLLVPEIFPTSLASQKIMQWIERRSN